MQSSLYYKNKLQSYFVPLVWLLLLFQLVLVAVKMRFSIFMLPTAFLSGAGSVKSLSFDVIEVSNLIKDNSLQEFSLSKELNSNSKVVQRLGEYNYPARLKEVSSIIVARLGEKEFAKCKLIGEGELVVIYDCANRK